MKSCLYKLLLILICTHALYASRLDMDEDSLKKMIGKMLIVGFSEESLNNDSQIVKDIRKYELGGVILFDRFYMQRSKVKNIRDPKQLQKLTSYLQNLSPTPLIIAIDQEGGKVARLKERDGFSKTNSAKKISENSLQNARISYFFLSQELKKIGINCNFAPVVDLSVEPENFVINKLERSYGKDPQKVVQYAAIFIEELKKQNILSVVKHFPGHGSSKGDSHKGFVDITKSWSEKELEPYKLLLSKGDLPIVMTAHVFNKNLDPKYPATLSKKINTGILREELGFEGVIISDDMQMKAISKEYSLDESITLAINSGIDILLFGNQLDTISVEKLIDTIYTKVQEGTILIDTIIASNKKIDNLKEQLK